MSFLVVFTHHFSQRHFFLLHIDRVEVGDAEVLPVERLREVVHLVDVEASVVDRHRLTHHEVARCEVLAHFVLRQLHDNARERRVDVIPSNEI